MPNDSLVDYSGQSVDGYQVGELLVRRRITALYLARDSSDEPVFVEILNSSREQDPALDGRFQQQMQALMQHPHPGFASILHVGHTANDHAYAVSQYVPGPTLAEKLEEWRQAGTTLSVPGALQLVKHLAQVLAVAHPLDIFHPDLSLDNVILREGNIPVLIGLGVPYQPEPPRPIKPVSMLDYVSPEQQQGKPINERSNIYSLGVILYELLAGHRPQIPISAWDVSEITTLPKEIPLQEARPGLTAATYELVNTCLWRQEWYRYETVEQFIAAVDEALAAKTTRAWPLPDLARFPRWLYVAAPLGLLLLILTGFLLAQGSSEPGTVTPLPATAVLTATLTAEPAEFSPTTKPVESSPTSGPPILLLAPPAGKEFAADEAAFFDWSYAVPLTSDQQFSVQMVTETGPQTLGIVTRPVSDSQYRLAVALLDWELNSDVYHWFVTLETASNGEELLRSEQQSFLVHAAAPTATPTLPTTLTLTPEVEVTPPAQTPSATCTPAPPASWVVYILEEGDYLYNLALVTGTTVARIEEVNCLTATGLSIGQPLWLPVLPPTATPTVTPTPTPTPTPVPTAVSSGGGSGGGPSPNTPEATKTPPPL